MRTPITKTDRYCNPSAFYPKQKKTFFASSYTMSLCTGSCIWYIINTSGYRGCACCLGWAVIFVTAQVDRWVTTNDGLPTPDDRLRHLGNGALCCKRTLAGNIACFYSMPSIVKAAQRTVNLVACTFNSLMLTSSQLVSIQWPCVVFALINVLVSVYPCKVKA